MGLFSMFKKKKNSIELMVDFIIDDIGSTHPKDKVQSFCCYLAAKFFITEDKGAQNIVTWIMNRDDNFLNESDAKKLHLFLFKGYADGKLKSII